MSGRTPECTANWTVHGQYTSLTRLVRELPQTCAHKNALKEELHRAHDEVPFDEFDTWAVGFRARVIECAKLAG